MTEFTGAMDARYCCRHQVVHDDELCCEHGIVHRGDALHHDDGSHRWTARSARGGLVARHELAIKRHVADGHEHPAVDPEWLAARRAEYAGTLEYLRTNGEGGVSDDVVVGGVTLGVVFVAACCAWLGYHGTDLQVFLAALALLVLSSPLLVMAVRYDPDVHATPTAALRRTEPKEKNR